MTILTILYTIIIQPIELLLTIVYNLAMHYTGFHIGPSIIVLSLVVNLLALPLYKKADKMQSEEKERQAAMDGMIKHIRKTFKGDERFFMLQTYYRQNDYKPVYVLKGSVSLLLQIPFFVAAYNFLSKLPSLRGTAFWIVKDMGSPDALLTIGAISINILPVIMTLINIVSGMVYTKGQPLKLKLQLYGMALVFLILLYNSPAGLVFYWILNNIFSLGKSIVNSIVAGKRIGKVDKETVDVKTDRDKVTEADTVKVADKTALSDQGRICLYGGLFLTIFVGCLIPTNVIRASVAEFVDPARMVNPAFYIWFSMMLALGTFVVWMGIYYALSDKRLGKYFSESMCILTVWAIMGYMVFSGGLGLISADLKYDNDIDYDLKSKLINMAILIAVGLVIHFLYRWKTGMFEYILLTALIAVIIMGIYNVSMICREYSTLDYMAEEDGTDAEISLSRNGRNVVFIMLDRAMGTQLPYIFAEKPELKEQFAGFTYYPNTVSFGQSTNFGAPSIYGGYEYTPWNINLREDETLADKHDEALRVLPVLFDENGYEVTVCDPPYAGYKWVPRLYIYDDHPDIRAYNTEGKFDSEYDEILGRTDYRYKRNLFCYSIMRISPLVLRGMLYGGGMYNEPDCMTVQATTGISKAYGYNQNFLDSYSVLTNLGEITKITDDTAGSFVMLQNSTTHEPTILKEPDYTPELDVDNTQFDKDMNERYTLDGVTMSMENKDQVSHYHVNMAALIQVGKWLDELKQQGIYDNTRIVIVSDHGRPLGQFGLTTSDGQDIEAFIPLLMMKDFGDREFRTSDEFMTNADCVSFMVEDVIADPVNPFTGNKLDGHEKTTEPVRITGSMDFDIDKNNGNRFLPAIWYTVGDDVYDTGGWEVIGEY